MSLIIEAGMFTYALTNGSITIDGSEGVKAISVYNGTTTSGTVLGTAKLGSLTPTANTVGENESWNQVAIAGSVIKNLVITAPSGCTLQIVAQI